VDVITCAIFGDCGIMGVSLVKGVILPSPIALGIALTTLPCDRVITVVTSVVRAIPSEMIIPLLMENIG